MGRGGEELLYGDAPAVRHPTSFADPGSSAFNGDGKPIPVELHIWSEDGERNVIVDVSDLLSLRSEEQLGDLAGESGPELEDLVDDLVALRNPELIDLGEHCRNEGIEWYCKFENPSQLSEWRRANGS